MVKAGDRGMLGERTSLDKRATAVQEWDKARFIRYGKTKLVGITKEYTAYMLDVHTRTHMYVMFKHLTADLSPGTRKLLLLNYFPEI